MLPPRKLIEPKVISNSAFLIPCACSVVAGLYWNAGLIIGVAIASAIYHSTDEQRGVVLDRISAYALVTSNLALLTLSGFRLPFAALAVSSLCVALHFFWYRAKDDWEWHVASACVSAFCILPFIV